MELHVFRQRADEYQLVGILHFSEEMVTFSYGRAYLNDWNASPISCSLPLREAPFSQQEASPFFAGLAPEGNMKRLVAESIHSDRFTNMLARLNNESIGGLVFSTENKIHNSGTYRKLSSAELRELRDRPRETSFAMGMTSRLSLAGAQSKVSLYHQGDDPLHGWFMPNGVAPTTHIIKTPDDAFPLQTVNEALCLETAKQCGFDVAEWSLIPIESGEPLLAIKRFDRVMDDKTPATDELPQPKRLHQEDFCQATGLMPDMKYEPTGGNYLARCCETIQKVSDNPFGDRAYFLQSVFFDYLIGNCDNHLKNHSLLWSSSWSSVALSPLYDITCTTMYPQIYLEMGISLSPSRRIDEVAEADIGNAAKAAGISQKMGRGFYKELLNEITPALDKAERVVGKAGFSAEAHVVAEHIRHELPQKVRW